VVNDCRCSCCGAYVSGHVCYNPRCKLHRKDALEELVSKIDTLAMFDDLKSGCVNVSDWRDDGRFWMSDKIMFYTFEAARMCDYFVDLDKYPDLTEADLIEDVARVQAIYWEAFL